ncbi:MAG: hypothetical protein IJC83_03825, partial [Oscillospiraceae bacterium]|nr:hypothetical protein [Oscillospiraceae bacterium]
MHRLDIRGYKNKLRTSYKEYRANLTPQQKSDFILHFLTVDIKKHFRGNGFLRKCFNLILSVAKCIGFDI